jgi:hypothetical protein
MTDVQRFADELHAAAGNRARVDAQDVWAVFTRLRPDDARTFDARQRLADLNDQAMRAGLLSPSVATDELLPVPLPRFVTVAVERAVKAQFPRAPWLPQLDWASELRLSRPQLDVLDRVNRWLREGGEDRPVVPAEERSLELFDAEKAIAKRIGGTTLWQLGRLDSDLLRYENVPIPFAYRQVGSGPRLLMVENTAAFRSCTRLLASEEGHPYFAVAFGQGAWAPKTVPAAVDLPGPITAIDYWGDLDLNGLAITRDVLLASRASGLAGSAHPNLWRLLLAQEASVSSKRARRFDEALLDVLPIDLRTAARAVLSSGGRIAQERLGYEKLATIARWWDPAEQRTLS